MPAPATLTTRALNRALLARQMLLQRESISPLRAIERLIGLQAQQPRPPFLGMWTRIAGFEREALVKLLENRKVVRVTMMRTTLHLVSAKDYIAFRSSMQPALTGAMQSIVQPEALGLDIDAVVTAAARCFARQPQTFAELRAALSSEFPDINERMMGYIARTHLPLIMVPDGAAYGFGADVKFAAAASWLGEPVRSEDRVQDLVLRYLAAFGPATVNDAQAWSALPKLKSAFGALRPKLHVFNDAHGKELFDLPNAPRPPEDTPSPARFLPGFDNVILSHKDRARIIADGYRPRVTTKNLQVLPTILVDGFVAGTWNVSFRKSAATMTISPFESISNSAREELAEEAENLARFLAEGAVQCELVFGKP